MLTENKELDISQIEGIQNTLEIVIFLNYKEFTRNKVIKDLLFKALADIYPTEIGIHSNEDIKQAIENIKTVSQKLDVDEAEVSELIVEISSLEPTVL